MANMAKPVLDPKSISFEPVKISYKHPACIPGGDGGGPFTLNIKGPKGEVQVNCAFDEWTRVDYAGYIYVGEGPRPLGPSSIRLYNNSPEAAGKLADALGIDRNDGLKREKAWDELSKYIERLNATSVASTPIYNTVMITPPNTPASALAPESSATPDGGLKALVAPKN
jgi:hypothetical protein